MIKFVGKTNVLTMFCYNSSGLLSWTWYNIFFPDATREALGIPREPLRSTEYANLERSLMSGLPNEVDFAVNVCMLLSNEGRHTLKGPKGLKVIELLLSHVGICKEGISYSLIYNSTILEHDWTIQIGWLEFFK